MVGAPTACRIELFDKRVWHANFRSDLFQFTSAFGRFSTNAFHRFVNSPHFVSGAFKLFVRPVIGASQNKKPLQPFCIVLPSRYRFMRQQPESKLSKQLAMPLSSKLRTLSRESISDDHG